MVQAASDWLAGQMVDAVGADTVTFAGSKVALIQEPFTPSPVLAFGDVVEADFDGSTAKVMNGTTVNVGINPATGDRTMVAPPPVGGWLWEVTGTTNLPQTIYGWVWYEVGDNNIIASGTFDDPIVLDGVLQQVFIPIVRAQLPYGALI